MLDVCSNWGTKHEMEHIFLMGDGHHWPSLWRLPCEGGTLSLKKRGPRRLPPLPSLISILELAICLVGKAHVTKMKLNFNFFPLGLQIPQISYCIFRKSMICTNLITCSANHLYLQLSAINKFCNTWFTIVFTV